MRTPLFRLLWASFILSFTVGVFGCSKPEEETTAAPPPVAAGQDGPQATPATGPGAGAGAATATN